MPKEFRAILNLKAELMSEEQATAFMTNCVEEWKRLHMGSNEDMEVIEVEEAQAA